MLLVLTHNTGEIYNTSANNWTLVPGAPVAPMLVRLPLPWNHLSWTFSTASRNASRVPYFQAHLSFMEKKSLLTGEPYQTDDAQLVYRADNHVRMFHYDPFLVVIMA